MADNLTIPPTHDKPAWPEAIKLIDTDEPVQGGLDGVDNIQAQQLAARSQWLKAQVDAVIAWAELTPDAAELDQLKRAIAAKFAATAARPATTTASGVVELATNAEAQAGTDAARAVTPAALAACTATENRAGMVELATVAEAKTGTDGARAVTPAGLAAALASLDTAGTMPVTAKSAAYIATADDITKVIEATANSWNLTFAPAADLGDGWWCAVRNAGTGTITLNPADAERIDGAENVALVSGMSCFVVCDGSGLRTIGRSGSGRAAGEVFWTRAATPPTGSLKANGAAVLREAYRALDAAIYVGDADNATAESGYRCSDISNPSTTRSVTGAYIVLPNLVDRMPIGAGGLYALGATGGEAAHTLTSAEMPSHTHNVANTDSGANASLGATTHLTKVVSGSYGLGGSATEPNIGPSAAVGGGAAHNNLPPYAALLPCIQY